MGLFDFFKKKAPQPQANVQPQKSPQTQKPSNTTAASSSTKALSLEERYGKAALTGYQTESWDLATLEFRKLEQEGLAEASVALGQLAQMENKELALEHFRKAAKKGSAEGAWGFAALKGHNYIADISGEDNDWYQYCLIAAKNGCCDAMNELGNMYNRINDFLGAFYWYQMAAYYEQPMGYQSVMALINKWQSAGCPALSDTIDGVEANEAANAKRIFRCMTKQDMLDNVRMDEFFKFAMQDKNEIMGLFIGHFFEDAVKMDGNAKMGYQIAAHNNSIMGMKCLADMLAAGKGCERNMQYAMEWYKGAADAGEKTACFIMGEFYRAKNKDKAAYYYSMAFRRGYEPAYTRLRQL